MSEDNEIMIKKQKIVFQMSEAVFYPEELVNRKELQKCMSFNLADIALLGTSFSCLAKLDLIVNYSINGMLSAYQEWFNSDRKYPLDKFSNDVGIITFKGINGLV